MITKTTHFQIIKQTQLPLFLTPGSKHPSPKQVHYIITFSIITINFMLGKKEVLGCPPASCGSFLLVWRPCVLLCYGASWDIMWVYQVTARVIGAMWVTEGLLILPLHHFLFPLTVGTMAVRNWTAQKEISVISRWFSATWNFKCWWYGDSNRPWKCKKNLQKTSLNGNYMFNVSGEVTNYISAVL